LTKEIHGIDVGSQIKLVANEYSSQLWTKQVQR